MVVFALLKNFTFSFRFLFCHSTVMIWVWFSERNSPLQISLGTATPASLGRRPTSGRWGEGERCLDYNCRFNLLVDRVFFNSLNTINEASQRNHSSVKAFYSQWPLCIVDFFGVVVVVVSVVVVVVEADDTCSKKYCLHVASLVHYKFKTIPLFLPSLSSCLRVTHHIHEQ